jgi:hypothetical protein
MRNSRARGGLLPLIHTGAVLLTSAISSWSVPTANGSKKSAFRQGLVGVLCLYWFPRKHLCWSTLNWYRQCQGWGGMIQVVPSSIPQRLGSLSPKGIRSTR